jgi:hypothetical protein
VSVTSAIIVSSRICFGGTSSRCTIGSSVWYFVPVVKKISVFERGSTDSVTPSPLTETDSLATERAPASRRSTFSFVTAYPGRFEPVPDMVLFAPGWIMLPRVVPSGISAERVSRVRSPPVAIVPPSNGATDWPRSDARA